MSGHIHDYLRPYSGFTYQPGDAVDFVAANLYALGLDSAITVSMDSAGVVTVDSNHADPLPPSSTAFVNGDPLDPSAYAVLRVYSPGEMAVKFRRA